MNTTGSGTLLLVPAPGVPVHGPSGASAHVRGLAEALRPDAIVCALTTDRRGAAGSVSVPVLEGGVPGWPSWLSSWREYREVWAARRVARIASRLNPRRIWERHSLYSDAGWKVHAATGCEWVLEVNAPPCQERQRYEVLPHPDWAAGWERDVLQAAPRVVAVSRWLCRWLTEEVGCQNVQHLPNGVTPHAGEREGTRASLGLGDRLVLGFVGSMKPWHGVERLPALLEALPDAVGLVVGGGVVPVHPRIVATGHVPEARVADLVAAMDVGLAPYGADAPPWFCPLKILAYRAQGTPVVAPDLGDCAELTREGGVMLEAGAGIDDWVDAVRREAGGRYTPKVRSWGEVVGEVW